MPGSKFSKKVNTPKKERQWEHVYDSALSSGADKGTAIKEASGVIKNESFKRRRSSGRRLRLRHPK